MDVLIIGSTMRRGEHEARLHWVALAAPWGTGEPRVRLHWAAQRHHRGRTRGSPQRSDRHRQRCRTFHHTLIAWVPCQGQTCAVYCAREPQEIIGDEVSSLGYQGHAA